MGRTVVVIGAGNTSVDAATQAKRLGAENVLVVYRRGPEDVSAYHYEYELAKADGVVYVFYAAPARFLAQRRRGGWRWSACARRWWWTSRTAARCARCPAPSSPIPCDMAITAVGQSKQVQWLAAAFPGLELDGGRVKTDAQGRTSLPRVYAGGDCVNGGKEVVNAVAEGKAAARALDADLGSPRGKEIHG